MENISESMKRYMDQHQLNANYQKLMNTVYQDADVQAFLKAHADQLNAEQIDRSSAKLYEYVNERNKLAKGETTFAPGYEPKLVLNDHLVEVSYQPTDAQKEKLKKAALKRRVNAIMMPKLIKNATFDNFINDPDRAQALQAAVNFIEAYSKDSSHFHQGLYLYGSFGVGKTYLLGAIANQLADMGIKTTLVHFPSFAVEMKNAIASNQVAGRLDDVKRAQILMIDDIGADAMSAWVRDDILGVILEYRMQNELPTFFSSNFSMKQLETEHLAETQKGDVEPLKAKRLMERIRFLAQEVEMIGENRRQKKS
ncbi:primosomal protein DnaI [Secundilactobacillus pentosiphilus]|uniref:Primosomal protein DnaI n=1 Tax=Secundilactobacillus pentosiphilus TaxID=1714682 RepID=A0A1Z5IM67_9LACO|nr:primosomal protein DnaI [Secundilactobacillus pentosiphilus]GAX02662.1 primosomal protein DnaI [Secundilactobacillus pentosiphilus]GAX05787.1 primosomal protein DnaI [Secundilactobacillus pentosiphilus]